MALVFLRLFLIQELSRLRMIKLIVKEVFEVALRAVQVLDLIITWLCVVNTIEIVQIPRILQCWTLYLSFELRLLAKLFVAAICR